MKLTEVLVTLVLLIMMAVMLPSCRVTDLTVEDGDVTSITVEENETSVAVRKDPETDEVAISVD